MTALRLVTIADVDELTRWMTEPGAGGEFQWVGFREPANYRATVESGELISDDGGALAVVDDEGRLLGDVSWRKVRTGPSPTSFCWSIGALLLPEHRGKGHGSRAQRLLVEYLFAHTTVERIEADTDVDNDAEQRSLDKAGFIREGVHRHAQWRDGAWRDVVVFSVLREEL